MTNPEFGHNPEARTETKVEQLFGHCFEIQELTDNGEIPVGGESVFSNEANIKVTGDFERMNEFFEQVHSTADKYNKEELAKWLKSVGIDVDPELFAKLFAFTQAYSKKYPSNPNAEADRKDLLSNPSDKVNLSKVFELNVAECAEIAAIGKYALQKDGITSSYFSGDILWDKDQEFASPHSFVPVRHQGKFYIWDVANPTETTVGLMPSIYTTEADFDNEVRQNRKRFVTSKNVLSKKEVYYGVSDNTNIDPERHIV